MLEVAHLVLPCCGTVQSFSKDGNGDLIATCENCGRTWKATNNMCVEEVDLNKKPSKKKGKTIRLVE